MAFEFRINEADAAGSIDGWRRYFGKWFGWNTITTPEQVAIPKTPLPLAWAFPGVDVDKFIAVADKVAHLKPVEVQAEWTAAKTQWYEVEASVFTGWIRTGRPDLGFVGTSHLGPYMPATMAARFWIGALRVMIVQNYVLQAKTSAEIRWELFKGLGEGVVEFTRRAAGAALQTVSLIPWVLGGAALIFVWSIATKDRKRA